MDYKPFLPILKRAANAQQAIRKCSTNGERNARVIPCVTGPVNVKLLNMSDQCVKIPKYAIVAEVLILHPIEYELEEEMFEQILEEDLEEGEELANESEEEIIEFPCQTLTTEHEIKKFQDAEYYQSLKFCPGVRRYPALEVVERCCPLPDARRNPT